MLLLGKDRSTRASYALGVLTCPTCGQENPDGARFCNACASAARGRRAAARARSERWSRSSSPTSSASPPRPSGSIRRTSASCSRRTTRACAPSSSGYGGTVEKFIGDAVMAVFGAPVAHEDDPERAVRAALAIRDWARRARARRSASRSTPGEALVTVGARSAEGEAMVAGDVVNTAARLQAAAPVDGVLVGERRTGRRGTRSRYREAAAVAGEGQGRARFRAWEAVEALATTTASTSPTAPRRRSSAASASSSFCARLVARDVGGRVAAARHARRRARHRQVAARRRAPPHVDGEPRADRWRQGRCLPYGDGRRPSGRSARSSRRRRGSSRPTQPDEAERKLSDAVARLVPEESGGALARGRAAAARRPAATAARAPSGGRDGRLAPVPRGARGARAAGARLRGPALGGRRPARLRRRRSSTGSRSVPLLVVGTARPELLERRPAWGGGKANATTISLQPLGDEETSRLIAGLLEQPVQPADEQQRAARAGGRQSALRRAVRPHARRTRDDRRDCRSRCRA